MVERSAGRERSGATRGVLLPGVAGIAMFLLLLALLNTFAALKGVFGFCAQVCGAWSVPITSRRSLNKARRNASRSARVLIAGFI